MVTRRMGDDCPDNLILHSTYETQTQVKEHRDVFFREIGTIDGSAELTSLYVQLFGHK